MSEGKLFSVEAALEALFCHDTLSECGDMHSVCVQCMCARVCGVCVHVCLWTCVCTCVCGHVCARVFVDVCVHLCLVCVWCVWCGEYVCVFTVMQSGSMHHQGCIEGMQLCKQPVI